MTPAVGDVDADGKPEIVVASYNSLYVIADDGKLETGWPYDVKAKHNANFSYQSAALGDLTGDGKLEIVTCCHQGGAGCYVFRFDGTLLTGWPQPFGSWSYSPPTLADLDGDGKLDVLAGRSGSTSSLPVVYAWSATGALMPGFPISQVGGAEGPIAVADIDLDGLPDIFTDSNVMQSNQGFLYCYDHKGNPKPGFPILTNGFTYMNGATVGDVDGDGVLDIGLVASNSGTVEVTLYTLAGPTTPGAVAWKTYHEGNGRRGLVRESDRFAVTGHATPGGQLLLELQAPPRSVGVIVAGVKVGVLPVPGLGILRLDITLPIFPLYATALLTGRNVTTWKLPNDPTLRGAFLPMQGVTVSSGQAALVDMSWIRLQ